MIGQNVLPIKPGICLSTQKYIAEVTYGDNAVCCCQQYKNSSNNILSVCTYVCTVYWQGIRPCLTKAYYIYIRTQTNVGTFECSFVYVTFVSRFFASKHLLIVFMPDLCVNFIQKVPLLL